MALALTAALGSTFVPASAAHAEPTPTAASKDEARDRFDRGLKLFNEGDNAGALAEFKRAYELIPNTLVLYNIGLVYAAMARPVDATDALAKVLLAPGAVAGERLARAKQVHAEQAARVAELSIVTNVPATIEVDNIEAGKTPLSAPLRVASGARIVGAYATGYAPVRKEITVAGGGKADLKFELLAMQGRAAHLTVRTHLPDADVLVDGQSVGRTPLPGSLTVEPGHRRVEFRREGYASAAQEITLGEGASAELTFAASEDRAALARDGGWLALAASETQPVITIDGQPRGVYGGPLQLLPGAHELLVERGGFLPVSRPVHIERGRTASVKVDLVPTPETRAAYASHAGAQRTWGIVATAAGAVLVGGAVTTLVVDASVRKEQQEVTDEIAASTAPGGRCDARTDKWMLPSCAVNTGNFDSAEAKLNDARTRDTIAYVVGGVGIASLAIGIYLLATGDNPHRYDSASALRLTLTPSFGAWQGVVLSGSY